MVAPTTEDDLEPCQVATRPDEKGANTIEFQKLSRAIDKAFDAMRLAETEVHNLETQLEKFYAEEREKVQGKVKARVTSLVRPSNIVLCLIPLPCHILSQVRGLFFSSASQH